MMAQRWRNWAPVIGLAWVISCGRGASGDLKANATPDGDLSSGSGASPGGNSFPGGTGGAFAQSGGTPQSGEEGGAGGVVPLPDEFVIRNVTWINGAKMDLQIRDGAVSEAVVEDGGDEVSLDGTGLHVFPAFIDSHVHLSYFDVTEQMARLGVLAAVDLAAPLESLKSPPSSIELLSAGPMVTSMMGYPTQGWGRDGYGLETTGVEAARAAVSTLIAAGARVIKVPLDGESSLTDAQVMAVTSAAHDAGLKVAVHALSADAALRGAQLGCDILAHTPTETLPDDVVVAWAEGAVVSTLKAFGAGETAQDNLKRLHEAGATVLYGTDLGNLRTVGVDVGELTLLETAGLSRSEALASLTTAAADYWGFEVGRLSLGGPAHFVLLDNSPVADLDALLNPRVVVFKGKLVAGALSP